MPPIYFSHNFNSL